MIKGWSWLAGSASSSSFSTMQTPSGTSPVATSPTDTLTWIAGSGVTITGSAAADSITIALSGGGAWTLTGNSGTTAGTNFIGTTDAIDFVCKTNSTEAWRVTSAQLMGIGVTAPETKLHVAGAQTTAAAPTGFSASQTLEQSNTAPTGSGTPTYGPGDSAGAATVTATQNSGSGNYFADGSTSITYTVYAVILFGGQYYYRGTPATAAFTDDNSAQNFTVDLAWTAVSGATSYVINATGSANTGNPNWMENVGNVTSFNDDGNRSSIDTVTDWATIAYPYNAGGTAPTAPSGTPVMTRINVGSGNKQSQNFTYTYDIDTCVTIDGLIYVSGTPVQQSANDGNDTQFFDWQIDSYTLNGGSETDLIVRRTTDGGGTYDYFFIGSLTTTIIDGTYVNDSTAQARWGQVYSGPPATITRQYRAYGYGASPTNGTTWYSTSFNGYSVVANNSVNGYVITHSITQGSQGNMRLLGDYAAAGDYSQNYNTSATSFVEGGTPNIWTAGSTVTPIHYGIQASGQTKYWRFYAQKTTPSTYYSDTYLQGSSTLPSNSLYYTITFSWTDGSGSTNTRILESDDGTTYSIGKLTALNTIVREVNAPSFGDGTTITPTSVDGIAIIGQNAATADANNAQIVARTSASSSTAARIDWQKSDGTVQGKIYTDASAGAMNYWTLTGSHKFQTNSAGNIADITTSTAAFNKTNNASYAFTINASSTSNGFKFDAGSSGQPKVWIGTVNSDNSGALQIINVTNLKNLFLKAMSGQSNNIIEAIDSASSFMFRVGPTGLVNIGSPGTTTNRLNIMAGTTSIAPIKLESGSLLSSAQAGALEFLTEDFYMTHTSTQRHPIASNNNPIGSQVFS